MIYFDNASTSHPKPKELIEEINYYLRDIGVSPGRGSYQASQYAMKYVNQLRDQLCKLFMLNTPSHLAFTKNATHSLNLVIKGILKEGDHVLICSNSHNAVIRPLETLKRTKKINYDIFDVDSCGQIDASQLKSKITRKTQLIVCNHASNAFGVVTEIGNLVEISHQEQIPILLDVTQTAGIIPLDANQLEIDFLAGTGHKTLQGPPGVGYLYVKHPEKITTLIEGGSDGNASSSPLHPQIMPCKLEAGTLDYLSIAGLKGSLDGIIKKTLFCNIREHGLRLTEYAWERLEKIPSVTLHATTDLSKKVPIISLSVKRMLPSTIASVLDQKFKILTRAGLHCSPISHKRMGTFPSGTLRISFNYSNTFDEIDFFVESLTSIIKEIN